MLDFDLQLITDLILLNLAFTVLIFIIAIPLITIVVLLKLIKRSNKK